MNHTNRWPSAPVSIGAESRGSCRSGGYDSACSLPEGRARTMTILFVIKNTANLRTLAPVVRALAERGHTLRIAMPRRQVGGVARPDGGARRRQPRHHPDRAPVRPRVRVERPGRADAPDDRLPALSRAGLPGRAEAPRAGRVGSTTGRSPARQRRPPDSRRARRGTLDAAGGRALHRAAAAGGRVSRGGAPRRDDDHAADRFRHVPGRPRPRREAARHPGLLSGSELGQPDQQGPPARAARPGARLERPPEAGGGRAARRSGRVAWLSRARPRTTTGSTGSRG